MACIPVTASIHPKIGCCGGGGGCPSVSLVCDSISASKSKCGGTGIDPTSYGCFGLPNHRYLDLETSGCRNPVDDCAGFFSTPNDYFPPKIYTVINTTYGGVSCPDGCSPPDCTPCVTTGSLNYTHNYCTGEDTCDGSIHTDEGCAGGPYDGDCSSPSFANSTLSIHFTTEYTTELLESNTIAALPDFSGFDGPHDQPGQGTSCSAIRNLGSDEVSYSIQRFKYKFIFGAATAAFTIYWTERFAPSGGGGFTDTDKQETETIGNTESSVFEIDEPDSNGTTTIVNIRWSFDATVCGVSMTPCGDPPILADSSCDPSTGDCTPYYDNCCAVCCPTDTCG